jgi:hypothetical protein
MARKKEDLLRPEDATSLEEFQARKAVEQARIRGMNSSWKTIGKILLSSVIAFFAIFGWAGFAMLHDGGRWFFLVIAIILTGLFLRIFGRIELRGAGGSKRYVQLSRLDKEWQAKAERGEIPRTTPGGPKVWKDQLEDQQAETG